MRAYGFTALGGPEVEAFLDVPEPAPGEGELLVRVRAAGVNPGDWRLREGAYGPVAPAVLGREVAGTVAALGPAVSGFAVGDEVFGGCPDMQGGFAPLARVTAGFAAHAAVRRVAVGRRGAAGGRGHGLRRAHRARPAVGGHAAGQRGGRRRRPAGGAAGPRAGAAGDRHGEPGQARAPRAAGRGAGGVRRGRARAGAGGRARRRRRGVRPGRRRRAAGRRRAWSTRSGCARWPTSRWSGSWAATRCRATAAPPCSPRSCELVAAGELDPHVSEVHPFEEAPAAMRAVESGHALGKVTIRL